MQFKMVSTIFLTDVKLAAFLSCLIWQILSFNILESSVMRKTSFKKRAQSPFNLARTPFTHISCLHDAIY